MKLYAFQPKHWGPPSFFVMAESEEEARAAIEPVRVVQMGSETLDNFNLTVLDRGQVIANDNG